jgi:hypothetical protein
MKKINNLILLFAFLNLLACTEKKNTEKKINTSKQVIQTPDVKINPNLTNIANFFGGISTNSSDSLIPSDIKVQWEKFNKEMNSIYSRIDEKKKTMTIWKNKNISISKGTLFYPFSGPDFLHANIFFPDYDTIIMIGLEPTGNSNINISNYTTPDAFNKISGSLTTILNQSFFRTKSMAVDFKSENLNGTLPIFLHFISRNQFSIQSIKDVQLNKKGELIPLSINKSKSDLYSGIEYTLIKNNKLKHVYFFSMNLMNTNYSGRLGLKNHEEVGLLIKNKNISSTYLKAASYLLHRNEFSILRNWILDNSKQIVQDDSGIPTKHINDSTKWSTKYFGAYIKPIPLFYERFQQELFDVYSKKQNKILSLPFGIGYKSQEGTSNMSISIKLK